MPISKDHKAIGFTICHKENPLERITVISLLEESRKKVVIADIKIRDGTTSFKKSGICRKAMKNVV